MLRGASPRADMNELSHMSVCLSLYNDCRKLVGVFDFICRHIPVLIKNWATAPGAVNAHQTGSGA